MPLPNNLMDKIFDAFGGTSAPAGAEPNVNELKEDKSPYEDGEAIAAYVTEFVKEIDKLRWSFERLWFRSILYYLGNQWLKWDTRSRRWQEKKVRKWVPKPVTNRFASTADTLCSAIQSTKIEPSAWPATDDVEDIAAANVADRVIEIINPEINMERVRESIAKWLTLNADAFCFAYYDKKDTSLGMTKIESLACVICSQVAEPNKWEANNKCPTCGEQAPPQPSGQFQEYPIGKLKVEVCSPLEIYLNPDIIEMSKQTKFTIAKSVSLDTAKQMFPDMKDKISPDSTGATRSAQYFMDALAYSTEEAGYNLTSAANRDRVTLFRHIEMPCEKYPEGLDAWVTMNQITLESGPSPFFDETKEGGKIHYLPLVKFGYNMVPGRLYSKTPMFDILSKQDQLNRLESLLELASMKGVNVNWIIPQGASIQNLSGEPAQIIRWTPTGTGGAKPEVVTVAPFHAAMLQLKEAYEADFEELAGTFDAMKGNTPSGVSAGYAIQLLTERSYGRFVSVFANWESGWTHLYTILLKLFRVYATEARMQKIKGATGSWEIKSFMGSDLKGAVDIKIEGGSARPRSKLAEQAMVEAMAKIGVIQPANPEQGYEIAKMFGMTNILGANDEDVRYASSEWQALLDWQPPMDEMGQPVPGPQTPGGQPSPFPQGGPTVMAIFDNHLVHIMEHKKPTRTDIYKQLEPWKQLFWQNHVLEHLMAMPPPPGSEPSQSGGKPGENKSDTTSKKHEKGDKTMDTVREGGSVSMGGSGSNQYQ